MSHHQLQIGPLLKYGNMHIWPSTLFIVHMIDKQYLLFHDSDLYMTGSCLVHESERRPRYTSIDVPQLENAASNDTGCSYRLWLVCAEVQLSETDR